MGSTPTWATTNNYVLAEQSGVLATLSTWRSRVQIPSRALKWHGTPIRQSDGFQTSVDVGSTPSRATRTATCVGWALAGPAGCNPVVPRDLGGSTPSRRTLNMARSSNGSGCETLILAIRVRLPYGLLAAKWWNRQTRDAQNVVPVRAWEFESPLRHSIAGLAGA